MTLARRFATALLVVFFAPVLLFGQTAHGPSTPEERARAVKVARQLEADPLGANAQADRKWLLKWIEDIPDITVDICPAILPSLAKSSRSFGREIWLQTMFSAAAFMIEHPNNTDEDAPYIAGVRGALTMYQNLLKIRPQAHWEILDELIQKRDDDSLDRYLRDIVDKQCSPEREPT